MNSTQRVILDPNEEDPQTIGAKFVSLQVTDRRDSIGPPRASSLYKACMRMHVLGVKLKRDKREVLALPQRITFGYGNAVHFWLQNTPDLFGRKRVGWWRCAACGEILYFGFPPTKNCRKCGAHFSAIFYHEHSLSLEDPYIVSGHPDMFLAFEECMRVVELKTINGAEFDSLKQPKIEHVWQILLYMWGMQFSKFPDYVPPFDLSRGYVIYISKIMQPGNFPVKSFPVPMDKGILKQIHARLGQFKDSMKAYPKGLPPKKPECLRNPSGYLARKCAVKNDCFNRE